jgi:hypothetical protein
LEGDYFRTLFDLINDHGCDISVCSYKNVIEDGSEVTSKRKIIDNKILEFSGEDALKDMLYQKNFDTSACDKLFKRELFFGIEFPYGKIFEDFGTIYKVLLRSKKVVYTSKKLYCYVKRSKSISRDVYSDKKLDYLQFAEEIYRYVDMNYSELKKAAASRCVSVSAHLLRQMYAKNKAYKEKRRQLYLVIKKYRVGLLSDRNVRKKNKFIILLSYLGFILFDISLNFLQKVND